MVYTYNEIEYLDIKRKEILPFATMWRNLKYIMLNEMSRHKKIHSMISFICKII